MKLKTARSPLSWGWARRTKRAACRCRSLGLEKLEARILPTLEPISLADPALYGASANSPSSQPSVSQDGQVVAFVSRAANLAVNDFNGRDDVYVFDRGNGQTCLVSVSTSGNAGNGDSVNPRVSGDGRFVVFESDASDLVAGDANGARDVFVRDLVNNTTTRVSVSTGGAEGDANSSNAVITPNGRYVAFESQAGNLAPGNDNFTNDVFLRDLVNQTTVLVSAQNSNGTTGNNTSSRPALSPDGRFVAFVSTASDLTSEADTNFAFDVFVRDTQMTPRLARLSAAPTTATDSPATTFTCATCK